MMDHGLIIIFMYLLEAIHLDFRLGELEICFVEQIKICITNGKNIEIT